jgi:hypothetical protein
MADQRDVRRIALSLPGTSAARDRFAFSVRNKDKDKGFVWVWQERVTPKKPRIPNPAVLAVRVANLDERDFLLSADDDKFFTEPHYEGFPAVLVRLAAVGATELERLITAAWRCQAPRALVDAFEGGPAPKPGTPIGRKPATGRRREGRGGRRSALRPRPSRRRWACRARPGR